MTSKLIKRKEVYWVDLGKTIGTEIYKIRPCLVISNNLQNEISSRIIIVPFTSQPVNPNILHIKNQTSRESYLYFVGTNSFGEQKESKK